MKCRCGGPMHVFIGFEGDLIYGGLACNKCVECVNITVRRDFNSDISIAFLIGAQLKLSWRQAMMELYK